MAQELEWAFTTLDRDPRVKVIVLTGSGDTFCAGADLEIGFSVGEKGKKLNLGDYRDRWVSYTIITTDFVYDPLNSRIEERNKQLTRDMKTTAAAALPSPSTAAASPPSPQCKDPP